MNLGRSNARELAQKICELDLRAFAFGDLDHREVNEIVLLDDSDVIEIEKNDSGENARAFVAPACISRTSSRMRKVGSPTRLGYLESFSSVLLHASSAQSSDARTRARCASFAVSSVRFEGGLLERVGSVSAGAGLACIEAMRRQ